MCRAGEDFEVGTLCDSAQSRVGGGRVANLQQSTCSYISQLAAAAPTGQTRD